MTFPPPASPATFLAAAPRAPGAPARLAWLFDVDGTLLLTGGASREAFAAAVREHLGIDDDLEGIAFAGRTEPLILADILARLGRRFEDGEEPRFWDSVVANMRALLGPARGRLMPGARHKCRSSRA